MNNVFLLLIIVGFLGVPICLLLSIFKLLKKKKVKPTLMCAAGLFALFVISLIGFGLTAGSVDKNIQEASSNIETSSTFSGEINVVTKEESSVETKSETVDENAAIIESILSSERETQNELSDEETFISELCKNELVTQEVAKTAYDILKNDMGFEKISVTGTNKVGNTNFDIKADNYKLMVTASDQLYRVICGDYTLYSDGTLKFTKQDLEDRKIGSNGSNYYVIAKEIVSSNLVNPSSAKFASMDNCKIIRKGDLVAVKGYVDAINSFNAKIRNEFVVEYKVIDLISFSYETVYININGDSSGKYIDLK